MAIGSGLLNRAAWGCHGIPERCLVIRGRRMKICARCFGSNIGHVLSAALAVAGELPSLFIAAALILPLTVDWSLQEFRGVTSTNSRRFITGILGGLGVGIFIWTAVVFGIRWILKYFIFHC